MGWFKKKVSLKTFPNLDDYLANNSEALEQLQREDSPLYWMTQGVKFDPEDQRAAVDRPAPSEDTTFPLDGYVNKFIGLNRDRLQRAFELAAESDEAGQRVNKQLHVGMVNLLVGYFRQKKQEADKTGSSTKRYFQTLKSDIEGTIEKIEKIDVGKYRN
tara:strand:- start:417 stop:893 length:477 start_codon:yes stop_codon:yes gene_type:complete